MTPKAQQTLLLIAVFFAGVVVGAFGLYTYGMWQVFDIQNEIR